MNGEIGKPSSLRQMAYEHRDLQQHVKAVKRLLDEPTDDAAAGDRLPELCAKLVELADEMQGHFERESRGGYLEEAAARLPRLSQQADALAREHAPLFEEVQAIARAASEAQPAAETWRRLAKQFEPFADRMLTHETTENQLLQQAFNEDPALFE